MTEHPDTLAIDIGANIGLYSLFAATLDQSVVAVEPFYDNVIRIHKAACIDGLYKRITLVTNAVSDKRHEVKALTPSTDNIGGQSLYNERNKTFSKEEMDANKYLVETILLDDLVEVLPKMPNGSEYTRAVLKIDIEGFEPLAFAHARRLFTRLDIPIIFMEWGNLAKMTDFKDHINNMMSFLVQLNYTAFSNMYYELDNSKWMSWPWDIQWRKTMDTTSKA